ncbi:MAG: uracil-DNA glycosylase [Sphaerochaetaceae bacterium]|nr:uracil-DNA glycosylase [Sphaerochaetaceae bacterium]
MELDELRQRCEACQGCKLCQTRTKVVFGEGNEKSDIMFIGEGPGGNEDLTGKVFVGPAGQLLDKMLNSIHLDRKDIYITNIVKCRPPKNRDPAEEEKKACIGYLRGQFSLIKPKILVCLGRVAATTIIDNDFRITKQRGQWYNRKGIWIIATYHPAALLRDPSKKKESWEDLKMIRSKVDEISKKETQGQLNYQ